MKLKSKDEKPIVKERVTYLTKDVALMYLFNEFDAPNLKVTAYLDEYDCWTGKVLIENGDFESKIGKDDKELFAAYLKCALCGATSEERETVLENLKNAIDEM